jgi:aminoglycoside phosphotransferase (APT) family kinase protein
MTVAEDMPALAAALRAAGLVAGPRPAFTALGGGVSSDILLVEDGGARFVVKRALARLRVRDEWLADVSRNQVERRYLEYVAAIVPEAVPRILGGNPAAGWFAMEYLGDGHRPWKQALLRGEADGAVAERAGAILGRIHKRSWGDPAAREAFSTLSNFEQLRIDPYLRTAARRVEAARPALTAEADRLASSAFALVHGDYSPKNLLAGAGRVIVLDAECGWYGDPAFDTAFLLNHLHLKALWHAAAPGPLLDLVPPFWTGYAAELGTPHADAALEARTVRLLLGLMLARIHGKSPVEYLAQAEQQRFVTDFVLARLGAPLSLRELTAEWAKGLSRL